MKLFFFSHNSALLKLEWYATLIPQYLGWNMSDPWCLTETVLRVLHLW